jgi:hypothetical protein
MMTEVRKVDVHNRRASGTFPTSPGPWAGLTRFLEQALELIAANRALADVLKRAYGTEHSGELLR